MAGFKNEVVVERLGVRGDVAGQGDRTLSGCLMRVNETPVVSVRRRVRLTRRVEGKNEINRETGGGLMRTGLEFIISITGRCRRRKLALASLVSRNGVKLVGTTRHFSRAHKFGFVSCTM